MIFGILSFLRLALGVTIAVALEDKETPTRSYALWTIMSVICLWDISLPAALTILTLGIAWAIVVFTSDKVVEQEEIEYNLPDAFKWFNENQWRGGQGDPLKIMFCKCNYEGLVEQYIKERKTTKTDNNEKP